MSDPEIARRCTACGITVREHAMFCPQCGNPIRQPSTPTTVSLSDTIIDTAPTETLKPDLTATPGVRGRVKQIRKVSSVVIDQAAYDPSLRFLLVAAVLILLFFVLLILSKVIG